MQVTRRSPRTGENNTREIECTPEQVARWNAGGELIQNVFPDLSPEDREFILTGYTPEDWDAIFADVDDE